ncbi:MAG: MBL fold metallo-hydrolase [Lachnospiraceae bacterium]
MLIVDPGGSRSRKSVPEDSWKCRRSPLAILLTHGHYDHILAGGAIRRQNTRSRFMPSEKEAGTLLDPKIRKSDPAYRMKQPCSLKADVLS